MTDLVHLIAERDKVTAHPVWAMDQHEAGGHDGRELDASVYIFDSSILLLQSCCCVVLVVAVHVLHVVPVLVFNVDRHWRALGDVLPVKTSLFVF